MSKEQIGKLQKFIEKENLDGFIVTRRESVQYLCGFTGTAGIIVVKPTNAYFLTDFRYKDQSKKQVKGARVIVTPREVIASLKDLDQFHGHNIRYGYESDYLICNELKRLQDNLPGSIMIPTVDAVEQFSILKDKNEIEMTQKAVDIGDQAFERILGYLKPGLREIEIAAELEYQMKMLGSAKPSFETIIASGYRSALPHGIASTKKIARGDFVTFDFGATYKGYVSDMTRTVVIGKATARQKKIYNIVLKAQRAGIRKIRHNVRAEAVDAASRKVIDKAGYKKYFGHGTGHGLGLFVHSKPRLGPKSEDVLKKGMLVTVEPGIYLPGWGGVRIEDDILVTATGSRILNNAPKNLLEL